MGLPDRVKDPQAVWDENRLQSEDGRAEEKDPFEQIEKALGQTAEEIIDRVTGEGQQPVRQPVPDPEPEHSPAAEAEPETAAEPGPEAGIKAEPEHTAGSAGEPVPEEPAAGTRQEQGIQELREAVLDLGAAVREISDRQVRTEKLLGQYIKENAGFQIQVRQGMQEELEDLRKAQKGEQYNALLKEIADVISVYRPLLTAETGTEDSLKLKKNTEALFEQLEDLLDDYGAEVVVSEVGSERLTRRTKIIRKIPTGNREQHNTIARSIRPGVVKGKLVLSEEYVDVYVYDASLDNGGLPENAQPRTEAAVPAADAGKEQEQENRAHGEVHAEA